MLLQFSQRIFEERMVQETALPVKRQISNEVSGAGKPSSPFIGAATVPVPLGIERPRAFYV